MNLEQALDELTRWQKEAERLQKLLDTNTKASQDALIIATQARDDAQERAQNFFRAHMDCHREWELGRSVACALDYDYLLKLVARVCLVYRAVRPDIEQDARHDLRWRELKDALDAFPDGP